MNSKKKAEFKVRKVIRGALYIDGGKMIKGKILQEDRRILNMYAFNKRASAEIQISKKFS